MLLGVDTGGTFTDFVLLHEGAITIHKVLSTPAAPAEAILHGIRELNVVDAMKNGELVVVHGSTVATNAALEHKGVKTAYITNYGLKDVLTIGRQARHHLYNLNPAIVKPPVPEALCLETGGRLDAEGHVIQPLTDEEIATLVEQINRLEPKAVAINLLFSFLDDSGEKKIASAINHDIFVSRSSFVLPEYGEYERGIATWLNAWLGPLVANYLCQLERQLAPSTITVMQSSGGTMNIKQAGKRAVNLLLSGPAGGLAAARYFGELCNSRQLLTIDMGGTSTDVALIDGEIALTNNGKIAHYPVAVPMVDMHTVGAGGGSIAYIDQGNALQVGPISAGAAPGPACYGQGGDKPTVTDANVVLGRLRPEYGIAGNMSLDIDAAKNAIAALAKPLGLTVNETALGIIDIANEHMTRALRIISVQRGYDPTAFQLCCFGGAGGLHVCSLAENLGIKSILLPIHGGVFSALGMLVAPRERQLCRTHRLRLTNHDANRNINTVLSELAEQGINQLEEEGISRDTISATPSIDLRYVGQSSTLNVTWKNTATAEIDFQQAHQKRYGHTLNNAIEVVNIRQRISSPATAIELPRIQSRETPACPTSFKLPGIPGHTRVMQRSALRPQDNVDGPAIICDSVSTLLINSGWQGALDQYGNLKLTHQ